MFDTHDMEEADYIAQCQADAEAEAQYIAEQEAQAQAQADAEAQAEEYAKAQAEVEEFEVEDILKPYARNDEIINQMIQKHEWFKKKWFQLTDSDLFDWLALSEDMECKAIELMSLYEEEKAENDVLKWERMIELKSQLDDKWKKIHTDSTADANIRKEFQQRDNEISISKLQAKQLFAKSSKVEQYINIVKIHMKKDYTV